jgi:hypothetical protein
VIYPLSQLFSCNSPKATQAEMLIVKLGFDSIQKSDRIETK